MGIVAAASKSYCVQLFKGKPKVSCKGLQKEANKDKLKFDCFKTALTSVISVTNRGIRTVDHKKVNYETTKRGTNYYYDKRTVMADNVSTHPIMIVAGVPF